MAELTVRLAALDGTWETCGVDRYPGVMPESFSAGANEWGADTCSFTLRRDPGDIHPDLSAFTPCEVEVNGNVVWEGRVRETPSRDGDDPSINVAGQGWQYHLDDDLYERVYVHQRLADWRDARTFAGANLARLRAAGTVATDDGIVTIGVPQGTPLPVDGGVGVVLDLGSNSTAKRVVLEWDAITGVSMGLFVYGSDSDPTTYSNLDTATSFLLSTLTNQTTATTLTTARRYLFVEVHQTTGGNFTPGSDTTFKLKAARVFADTAYESANVSALKASTVVGDALDKATVLLSSDRSLVSATSFNLPELALDGFRTPREAITAVNAYHRWRAKIASGRRMMFAAQPSAPVIEAGNWDGFDFEDASANSGEEIYNRVIVEGTGPDGAPLRVARAAGELAVSAPFGTDITAAQVPNPSFDTNTTGWTPSNVTLTRDTTTFASSPASGKLVSTTPTGGYVEHALTGTFRAGVQYTLRLRISGPLSSGQPLPSLGAIAAGDYATNTDTVMGVTSVAWDTPEMAVMWTPQQTYTSGVVIRVSPFGSQGWQGSGTTFYIDSFALTRSLATLVDRRGFRRTKILPVSSAIDTVAAKQIADVFLAAHRTTPLKGGGRVVGQGGIRRVVTGESVHPSELLLLTTEILRLQHRIDPDTGAQGRDGVLASVNYTHATEEASVQLDNERNSLESLLNRMAVVTGAGR